MGKIKIWIVTFYSIALFFIGMSIFADKTSTIGMLISIVGYGSLLFASVLSIIQTIAEKRNK